MCFRPETLRLEVFDNFYIFNFETTKSHEVTNQEGIRNNDFSNYVEGSIIPNARTINVREQINEKMDPVYFQPEPTTVDLNEWLIYSRLMLMLSAIWLIEQTR